MPYTDLEFLQHLTVQLKPEQPLEAHSKLYVPLYEPYSDDTEGYIEPTKALLDKIELSKVAKESIQYFSGFRGSGKSTLLKQLVGQLEAAGYIAVYADANEYISKNAPVSITDLLYTLAVAFGTSAKIKDNKLKELWLDLWDYLTRTGVEVKELGLSNDFLSINLELKGNETLRTRFRKAFETHIEQLNREIRRYFEQTVQAIKTQYGNKQIVFIFDNLEKIEGADANTQLEVQRSVEFIFNHHRDKLSLPYIHAVYTIPPWLKFIKPLEGETVELSGVRMWHNNPERTEKEEGIQRLRLLLQKRFEKVEAGAWKRFFGTNPDDAADQIIRASGGDIRDLFRMTSAAMLRTQRKLPVSDGVIKSAINHVRGNYLPLSQSNAILIEEVARTRTINPENEKIEQLKALIDSHMILFFKNGGEWYDANQLILPEARYIVEELRKQNE